MENLTKLTKGKILPPLIFTFISFGILILLFFREKEAFLEFDWRFRIIPLVTSFIVFSINLILMSFVWYKILLYLGYVNDIRTHFRVYWISNFMKRIPGTIWYIIGRAKLYETNGIPKRLTAIASGIEYAMLVLSSFVVGFIFALDKVLEQKNYVWIAVSVFIICLIIVNPKTIRWIFIRIGIDAASPNYKALIGWFAVYIVVWIGNGMILFLMLNTISYLEINNLFFVVGSVAFVNLISSALFFAPSNFGVGEVTLSLMLSSILPTPISVFIALLSRMLLTFYDFIWAIIGYFLIPSPDRK